MENPPEITTHKFPKSVKSIIKVPYSKYKIEAEPVSEDEPESPEKEIQIAVDEMLPEQVIEEPRSTLDDVQYLWNETPLETELHEMD